ncbi:MAG: hypothetical protein U1F15_01995 [Burkholderiales bacterium]
MDDARIAIRTWRNEVRLARDHPAPERVRADVDRLTAGVAAELAAGIGGYVEGKDGALFVVRALAFDCDVDLTLDAREIARHLARRCAHALVGAIESGSADVVRFASPAEFRARFVADLAAGHAWGTWYYRSFDGLAMLPAAAAMRTALLDDPAVGRAALAAIDETAWPAIASALTSAESARIVDGLTGDGGDAFCDPARIVAWAMAAGAWLRRHPASATRNALVALAAALRAQLPPSRSVADAARLIGALAAEPAMRAPDPLVDALRRADVSALAQLRTSLARPAIALIRRGDGAQWADAVQAAASALAPALADQDAASDDTLAAPFAGYALLLDAFDTLLDAGFGAALPEVTDGDARGATALCLLALAAGPGRSRALWRDPAWREFLAVPPQLSWSDFSASLAAAPAERAARAHDAVAEHVGSFARGARVSVGWRSGTQRMRADVDVPTRLWLDVREAPPRMRGRAEHASPAPDAWTTRVALARGARADLAAIAAGAPLPAPWRLVFAHCVQFAWRRLAYRVTGMAGASIDYLRANLVAPRGEARRVAPDRWRWHAARPPLHVLLQMSGVARREIRWSGSPPRHLALEFG